MRWPCWSIDIKLAFYPKYKYRQRFYVRPPKEAECNVKVLWKLNTTIYGLNDASRSWN